MLIEYILHVDTFVVSSQRFLEQIVYRKHQMGLDFVVGGLGHCQMKICIVFNYADLLFYFAFHRFDAAIKAGDIIIFGPYGGMVSIPGFNGLSDFDQLKNSLNVIFYKKVEGFGHPARRQGLYNCPLLLGHLQKPHASQGVEGFTQGRAAYIKDFDELSFGGQGITRF